MQSILRDNLAEYNPCIPARSSMLTAISFSGCGRMKLQYMHRSHLVCNLVICTIQVNVFQIIPDTSTFPIHNFGYQYAIFNPLDYITGIQTHLTEIQRNKGHLQMSTNIRGVGSVQVAWYWLWCIHWSLWVRVPARVKTPTPVAEVSVSLQTWGRCGDCPMEMVNPLSYNKPWPTERTS